MKETVDLRKFLENACKKAGDFDFTCIKIIIMNSSVCVVEMVDELGGALKFTVEVKDQVINVSTGRRFPRVGVLCEVIDEEEPMGQNIILTTNLTSDGGRFVEFLLHFQLPQDEELIPHERVEKDFWEAFKNLYIDSVVTYSRFDNVQILESMDICEMLPN